METHSGPSPSCASHLCYVPASSSTVLLQLRCTLADMIEHVPHSQMELHYMLFCCPPCPVSNSDTSKSKMANLIMQATPANWPYNHDSIGKKGWAFLLPTVSPEDAQLHFPDHHSCKVTIASPALQHTLISSESCRKVITVCTHLHMDLSLSCASSSLFPDTCHNMSAALHASGPCLFCC